MQKKILLGLTTTPKSNWREKIEETSKYNIKEIALFPTYLGKKDRDELYKLLEESPVESIPHVHLRNDMEIEELDYLADKFGTKVFNIHSEGDPYRPTKEIPKYKNNFYVENTQSAPTEEELKKYAGLCIDFSHWEDFTRGKRKNYEGFELLAAKFKIGCSHISAVKKEPYLDDDPYLIDNMIYSCHMMEDLSELYYIKKYLKYLPELISIELENSFKEQLEAKKYLEKIINI